MEDIEDLTLYREYINLKNSWKDINENENNIKIENFLQFFITKYPVNYNNVIMLSHGLKKYIDKPQRILNDSKDFYVAIDLYTNLYYICFRDILMIDIDMKKNNDTTNILSKKQLLESAIEKIKNDPICCKDVFYIEETTNGYHLFVINRRMKYNDKQTIEYMLKFQECDIKYTICTYLRGFCIRLNKKHQYDDMYKFNTIINEKFTPTDISIMDDINYIKYLTNLYSDVFCY